MGGEGLRLKIEGWSGDCGGLLIAGYACDGRRGYRGGAEIGGMSSIEKVIGF